MSTEQTYVIKSAAMRAAAANAVMAIAKEPLMQVTISEHIRLRTSAQNARYWASLAEEMRQMKEAIHHISEHTGHTQLEARRIVADDLEPEQIAILYARTQEAVHDILKTIHGIPTSTRLGTKAFMQFEERMIQSVAEVNGAVKAMQREAT